jgi:hypothetical protein
VHGLLTKTFGSSSQSIALQSCRQAALVIVPSRNTALSLLAESYTNVECSHIENISTFAKISMRLNVCVHVASSAMLYCHHHHHHERNSGLGLRTCSYKAQAVPDLSIFV